MRGTIEAYEDNTATDTGSYEDDFHNEVVQHFLLSSCNRPKESPGGYSLE